jgi:hypothetical protein
VPARISEIVRHEESKSNDDRYLRDSNQELASKLFSKQAIYKALEIAKDFFSTYINMTLFLEAKRTWLGVKYIERKWYKEIEAAKGKTKQEAYSGLFKPAKQSGAHRFTFPQFRLSIEQAQSVMS